MYSNNKIDFRKSETVSLAVNANGLITKFPDIEKLRNKYIRAVEVFKVTQITKSEDNLPLQNAANFSEAYLTLTVKGQQDISKLPFYSLNRDNNNGTPMLLAFLQIDFPKSLVEVPEIANLVAGEAYQFVFYYYDKEDLSPEIRKEYNIK